MKKAIIDLGTNTCNLLVIERMGGVFHPIHTSKVPVKLGKGGINNRQITVDAIQRTIIALQTHLMTLEAFGKIENISVIATSAVRDAENKDIFIKQVYENTRLRVQIIDGNEEADYIADGVRLALGKVPDGCLIMDIGGGSNEFIIMQDNIVIWKQSFPTGIARVIERFPISDPIMPDEIQNISDWFDHQMKPLWDKSTQFPIHTLVGCSGTFDTIADIIEGVEAGTKKRVKNSIQLSPFKKACRQIIHSTERKRQNWKTIEKMRIEMIVPAVVLVLLTLQKFNIKHIIQTDYALKEGIMAKNNKKQ